MCQFCHKREKNEYWSNQITVVLHVDNEGEHVYLPVCVYTVHEKGNPQYEETVSMTRNLIIVKKSFW